MFRVKKTVQIPGCSLIQRVVQVTLIAAILMKFGTDYFIVQEQRHLSTLLEGSPEVPSQALEALRQNVGIQFASNLIVSAILLFCLAVMWWLSRQYSASQQSLRRLKVLAHDILASMDRGVVTSDRAGIITSINSAGIRLLEVDFECVGKPLAAISSAELPLLDMYREVVEGQAGVVDQVFNVARAGHALRFQADSHVLMDSEGEALGCVIHLRDATDRTLLEERMRRMERFLSLATLASGLHHEIKNPLTALSIHIQLLEESLSDGQPLDSVDETVSVLKTEVLRLNGVLESFRSFAHLQSLSLQPTDAMNVVEKTVRLIRPQAAKQRVQIALLRPENDLPNVLLDAEKFEQAVLNLVINALEAMPEGGTLTISASEVDGELRVSVKDSGSGISPEVQKSLFQPYFSTKTNGSGMGLALTEKLISQHGGHINYCTGPEGTTFAINVPLDQRNGVV